MENSRKLEIIDHILKEFEMYPGENDSICYI